MQGFESDQTLALAICEECPVRLLCRNFALVHDEYGIWGGTTDKERASIKKHAPNFMRRIRSVTPLESPERPVGITLPGQEINAKEELKKRADRAKANPLFLTLPAMLARALSASPNEAA